MRGGAVLAALAVAWAMPPAAAQAIDRAIDRSGVLSLRDYETQDQLSGARESGELNAYLRGVADSLTFANAYLQGAAKPKLFCTDERLDAASMRRILDRHIGFLASIGQNAVEVKRRTGVVTILIQKLREAYPCR